MSSNEAELVAVYLQRLTAAASALPADRATELIEEITAHIAEARAAGSISGGVPAILEQLGQPEDIVRAADGAPWLPGGPSGPLWPAGMAAGGPPPQPASDRPGALEIAAVILLLIGGLVVPIVGWLVGVVLLWVSRHWRTSDKLLGTFVWPGGLLAPVVVLGILTIPVSQESCESGTAGPGRTGGGKLPLSHFVNGGLHCSGSAPTPWLVITIAVIALLVSVAGPIVVAIRLLRARRQPYPASGPAPDLRFTPAPVS